MTRRVRPERPAVDHGRTASVGEAKTELSSYVNEVKRTRNRVTITENGQPAVALISLDELDSLEATVEELSDPGFWPAWYAAQANINAGRLSTIDEVWDEIERRQPGVTRPRGRRDGRSRRSG